MYQLNNRVSEVWEHHGGYDPNATTWPGRNISALIYGYAPDGQETWGARQPDGGASGSALEDGEGENYAYNSDSSIAGFGYRSANTQQTPNSQGDSNAEAPVAGPGSYGNNYTYDASGNRTQANQMGANISYGADGENRYYGSLYDGNSNTTDSAVGWTYAYDAQGQMTSATRQSDGFGIGFAYDGLGRLVYQGSPAGTTIFCYAGKRRIEERSTNGNTSLYRYFFDSPKSDEIVFRQTSNGQEYGGTRLYYQYDAQGNTTHVSNDAGQVIEQYLYDAYGKPYVYNAAGTYLGQVGTQDNRYLFHGASAYEWLSTPGLYYCRHRMYLPIHGRWLQPDPSGFAGGDINLYRYCGNDPVDDIDPSGKSFQSTATAVGEGLAIGFVAAGTVAIAGPLIGAGLTAGLLFAGVDEIAAAALVTGGAAAVAVVGTGTGVISTGLAVMNAQQTGNWDQVGFDAGVIIGSSAFTGSYVAVTGGDWSVGGLDLNYDPDLTSLQNFVVGMSTMPTDESAALASSAAVFATGAFVGPDSSASSADSTNNFGAPPSTSGDPTDILYGEGSPSASFNLSASDTSGVGASLDPADLDGGGGGGGPSGGPGMADIVLQDE